MLADPENASVYGKILTYVNQQQGGGEMTASQRDKLTALSQAEALVNQYERSLNEVGLEESAPAARVGGTLQKFGSSLGLASPQLRSFLALRGGTANILSKSFGQVGNLSDRDIALAVALIPDITDSKEESSRKLQQLRNIIAEAKSGVHSSTGPVTGGTSSQEQFSNFGF